MASPIAEALATVPFFALLSAEERAKLADQLEVTTFQTGAEIFARGDPGDRLFVVQRGKVQIFIKNDTGHRIEIEELGPGDFFGEVSLLDGGPRSASAVAAETVDAIVVDREDLDEFLRLSPESAMSLLTAAGRRLRESMRLLRGTASRNPNIELEDSRTTVMKVADWISEFSGSLPFLFIHIGVFFVWIILNTGPLARTSIGGFDPFPFGLLTMVVSLEAIILSVFVLLSQNRQVARDRVRNDVEYEVNVRAELEVAHLHEKIDHMQGALLARLERLEGARTASLTPRKGPETA